MIKRSLDATAAPLLRARLLPTAAEVALAVEDQTAAQAHAGELADIAAEYGTSSLVAHSEHAAGANLLAQGDPSAACERFRTATDLRLKDDLPYLAAKSRMLLAKAYGELGDNVLAELEYSAARTAFTDLGATKDMAAATEALNRMRSDVSQSERHVTALMFTDIVDSTRLIGVIGDEPWEALLRWHHRTLRALFADHEGHEVENTGDGFFVAFGEGAGAIACAIAIQNTLAAHRRDQGFAPNVRIGINKGEVSAISSTLAGEEVHRAARICSAAEPGEILLTADLADEIPPGVGTEKRLVELKGFTDPTEVVSIIPV